MKTLTIEIDNKDSMDYALTEVLNQFNNGNTSGVCPGWYYVEEVEK